MDPSNTDRTITRRSFIKTLLMSLFSFGAAAKFLLSPKSAYAANCYIQVCYPVNGQATCVNHVYLYCTVYKCYAIDQPGFLCSMHTECVAIGCC